MEHIVKLFKILNFKSVFHRTRFRDNERGIITMADDNTGMHTLAEWVDVTQAMCPSSYSDREHKLSKDTAQALRWTLLCLVDLSKYLLTTSDPWQHEYVCLGFLQQDDLERHFGHFRASAGCNFYITVKDVVDTRT